MQEHVHPDVEDLACTRSAVDHTLPIEEALVEELTLLGSLPVYRQVEILTRALEQSGVGEDTLQFCHVPGSKSDFSDVDPDDPLAEYYDAKSGGTDSDRAYTKAA